MIEFQKNSNNNTLENYVGINWLNNQLNLNSKDYYEKKETEIRIFNEKLKKVKEKNLDEEITIEPKTLKKAIFDYNFFTHKVGNSQGKSLFAVIKLKDLFLKIYPEMRIPIKNGLSIKKIMETYTLSCLPQFEISKIICFIFF